MSEIEKKIEKYMSETLSPMVRPDIQRRIDQHMVTITSVARQLREKILIMRVMVDKLYKLLESIEDDPEWVAKTVSDIYQLTQRFGIEDLIDWDDTPAGPLHPRL